MALQNTQFVKSAHHRLQQNQATRYHAPSVPDGEMSKDLVDARNAAAYKLMIELASAADGQNAHLRGHWAFMLHRLAHPYRKRLPAP